MTLPERDRGTIKCYKQFGWRGCEICRRFKEKKWDHRTEPFTSVAQLKRRVKRVWESVIDDYHRKKAIL